MLYYKNRHACYLLQYHLVVCTKYRHSVISGKLRERLLEITHTILEEQWNTKILSVNTDKDHIHILFEAPPQVQPSKLINNYKTVSSRLIRKEFQKELAPYYWKPYFWSDAYFICTVSDRTQEAVEKYIREQGKH
ncbi:MAG: IS200/IS605 family transposase [Solobacterium sp.]|nr:IS200/IS605 family transposase [Solobacterium sp.]MCH4222098.1 IS200/IS605 family transposase [Solobacterium sp.]